MQLDELGEPRVMRHELLARMNAAADAAAARIRAGAATLGELEWRAKASTDFVSDVDTGAEALIRERLLAAYPDAAILGEELSPAVAAGAGLAFIVDPLDGTTNFLHGYPEYAVSIAARMGGETIAGVVLNAATGERCTATLGEGAWRGPERLRVSAIAEPARALIGTGFPFKNPELVDAYLRQLAIVMRATAGVRRAGSAALDLADVACGRFDAFWELVLAPWDFAAGQLLVREAGGVITDTAGADVPLAPSSILAGNPVMHGWLRDVIASTEPG